MYIYSTRPDWESLLTCIYEAWSSKRGFQNIKIVFEPIEQYTLFDEYIHVDADSEKATKLMDAINQRISPWFYSEIAYASMAYEEEIPNLLFHMILLGFKYGPEALKMVQFRDVMDFSIIRKRLGSEIHSFIEFIRFHDVGGILVAHIEPKSRVLMGLRGHFSDRMPSERWIIVDDIHREAVVHPANEECYLQSLTEEEFDNLIETEKVNDNYTDMWKVFYDSIAIKERQNEACQNNLFPKWKRKHAVEFL